MSNGLSNVLSLIGKDKYIHFTVCLIFTLFVFAVGGMCGLGIYSALPAMVLPVVAGILKECSDKKKGGEFSKADIAADFLGMFVGMVLIALLCVGFKLDVNF